MRTSRPLASAPAASPGVTDVRAARRWLGKHDQLGDAFGDQSSLPRATGLGTLEASRGGEHVIDPDTGVVLTGELDAQGTPWDPSVWVAAEDSGTTWDAGWWNTRPWTGTTWTGSHADAVPWSGDSWSGQPWEQHAWTETGWEGRSWREASWLGRSWRGLL